MTLHDSVLKDTHERWGAIVANHQFQFDGPIPQAGTIYSAGWSIKDGYLYLGDSNIFINVYQEIFIIYMMKMLLNNVQLLN